MRALVIHTRYSRLFQPALLFSSLTTVTIWAVIGVEVFRRWPDDGSAASAARVVVLVAGGLAMTALTVVFALAGLRHQIAMRRRHIRLIERARKARRDSQLLTTAIEVLPQGIAVTDANRNIVMCNRQMAELAHAVSAAQVQTSPKGQHNQTGRHGPLRQPDGTILELMAHPLPGGGALQTAIDVTELHRADRRLREIAHYDQITRLANWGRFREALELLVASDQSVAFGVLLIDIDGFKGLNEQHGLRVGDKVLRIVGDRLRRAVRASDLVARTGPDEFSLALVGLASPAVLETRAVQLADAIRAPIVYESATVAVTVSTGAIVVAGAGARVETILFRAAAARDAARKAGGNCCRLAQAIAPTPSGRMGTTEEPPCRTLQLEPLAASERGTERIVQPAPRPRTSAAAAVVLLPPQR